MTTRQQAFKSLVKKWIEANETGEWNDPKSRQQFNDAAHTLAAFVVRWADDITVRSPRPKVKKQG